MANLLETKVIQFPPVDNERKLKVERFLKNTQDFMDVDFEIEQVTIVQVRVPTSRGDVITIVNKVMQNEKKLQKEANGKPAGKK